MLDKLNRIGIWLNKKLFKREIDGINQRTMEVARIHPVARRLNELVTEYKGILTLFIMLFMVLTLYFIYFYLNGFFMKCQYFLPVEDLCSKNYDNWTFMQSQKAYRTSTFTQTACFNPRTNELSNLFCKYCLSIEALEPEAYPYYYINKS